MASYAEDDRQARQEQLDWLAQHHAEMQKQTDLMELQLNNLRAITKYVGWLLAIAVVPIVLAFIILLTNGS